MTLSNDLKVACEIYHITVVMKNPVWFSKLHESLFWCIPKYELSNSIDILSDWDIIYGRYDKIADGKSGYCLFINNEHISRIKELYDNHWINERR